MRATAADAERIVRDLIRPPRPHQELTRSINECDIVVNSALGQAAHAIRAEYGTKENTP